ncbi:hypothetical protein ACFQZZ_18640 [Nocardia sp. GCM10030253]|uniref:hypothetical protein n=1 Tax=Nocardia sp. GCM10030253 TaxID=3273404 RepID=UPI00362B84A5
MFDANRTRALRKRWRWLAAVSGAVVLALVALSIGTLTNPFEFPGIALFGGIFIAGVACAGFWTVLRQEDGVRFDSDATDVVNRDRFNSLEHDLKFVKVNRG